ncbi:uncharacterized protein LOC127882167 [Dreissena polymorpha]|uniref:Uncharacterized protein n=1 Tax=Dreissena polymorpha TaxID=45954 RepID=A0A9D4MTZ3_DREPO|nr:uncharacterized protein LOC127882167 [Dreissena polymorpha]XP_052286615.1 uncharacterized protein LOC127882167 [Dreissena polymorpha]XP_052286625.1 uncharacterized protein LOC127882167 [Dreissena polymorpha]XP_052286633.1 uncharacterized protein LOC127882167 [Dreissena polymorpha]KAH3882190.1 hypothetical protein DPMN_006122 [Dreissena polymorpha]
MKTSNGTVTLPLYTPNGQDIRDCNDEMSVLTSAVEANTQYESFQRLTLSKNLGCRAMSMSQEHLQSSSADYEIPMLHNPQSMNIMQSDSWTYLDEIKPANQKDSLLLLLLSY